MQVLYGTVILSLLVGVATSIIANSFLTERIAIIGSFVGLEHTLNRGIAFGMKIPGVFQIILIVCALFFVMWYAAREAKSKLSQVGFGLIIGGGLANIVDRFGDGVVTDLFQVGSFPIFNVADSCISVGIFVLFWEMVILKRSGKPRLSGAV
ncbi:signal peptidase II [Patescibacteria group bacterium]|nr:signal peptidase II [Patescibacteria group bacterium]MBU1124242.1 signal peptidase II [Patescibacteria group bacterium]MBU1910881.1 signal peptidase II [Patescibacteria group bacterium]